MCLDDLAGRVGAVTAPPCAASVPIPAELAKAIEEELKDSSGVISDSTTDASGLPPRPTASMDDLCTKVGARLPPGTPARS